MFDQEKFNYLHVPCYVQNLSKDWEKALYLGRKQIFKKGESFTLGNEGTHFGYIQSGITCHLILDDMTMKDEIRFFIGPECLVKDTFVSAGYGAYRSSHKCLTDVTLYQFNREILYSPIFFEQYPDLIQNYIFSVSAKSVSLQFFASILKRCNNEQKIAIFLYGFYLLNRHRRSFKPPFSQVYLAKLLGISKLTVNRIISVWKDKGIISNYTKNNVTINDVNAIYNLRSNI